MRRASLLSPAGSGQVKLGSVLTSLTSGPNRRITVEELLRVFGVVVHSFGGAVLLLFWIWAVLDCISTDSIIVRNLPKTTWVFLVIFIPTIGAVCWLLLGRPEHAGLSLGGQRSWLYEQRPAEQPSFRQPGAGRGIEDDPNWRPSGGRSVPAGQGTEESLAIRERKLLEREAELAKREAALDDDGLESDER